MIPLKWRDLSFSLSPTLSLAMATTYENKLEGKPVLAELIQHVRVGNNWYLLGVLLKLDGIKLDDIRRMTEGNDFKSSLMFQLWLKTNPNATRRQVIDVLKKESIKELTIADNYEKAFPIQSEPSGKDRLFLKEIYSIFSLFNIAEVIQDTTNQIAPLDQNDRTTYEHSAISIFQRHFGRLQQSLQSPISVARFLHDEKIISEMVLNSVKSASQTLGDRRIILLTALQDAINTNYQFLKVFADVLSKFTENVPLANAILKDYSKCVGIYYTCMYVDHTQFNCMYVFMYMCLHVCVCVHEYIINIFLLMGNCVLL